MAKAKQPGTVETLQAELVAVRALARARYEKWKRSQARATHLLNQNHKLNERIRAFKAQLREVINNG